MPSTIPLAKGLNYDKLVFPVYVSQKVDGVPIKLTIKGCNVEVTTRSGKGSTTSCEHIKNEIKSLAPNYVERTTTIIGEVTHKTDKAFKDVSGHVRRMVINPDLRFNAFDYSVKGCEKFGFGARSVAMSNFINKERQYNKLIRSIPQVKCNTVEELNRIIRDIPDGQEGWIIRNGNDPYVENKRSWGYQKVVKTPTKDLLVSKFDEAISKDGEPLNMVGKIWLRYEGNLIGCGPGKLTHQERKDLWAWAGPFNGEIEGEKWIAEVKYKEDPSYDALREASFVCWRFDKDEPNET